MVNIIKPSFKIESEIDGIEIIRNLEKAGRTCYKSEDRITEGSAKEFVRMILERGHESVLEHEKVTVRVICDRGVTHEIVRHRIASYSQESTRYCNYTKGKFGNAIAIVIPYGHLTMHQIGRRDKLHEHAEQVYFAEIREGVKPQIARGNLFISNKSEIVITQNLRQWRHFFRLRTSKAAHPQMRELMIPMLKEFQIRIPIVFDDIEIEEE